MPPLTFYRSLLPCLVSAAVGSYSGFSHADEAMTVTPFGQINLSQKEQNFSQLLDQNLSFYMLRAGGGLAYGKAYLGIYGDWSLRKADVSEEEEIGTASRTEYDLSLGYLITDNISLIGGYKYGKTEIDFIPRDWEDDPSLTPFSDSYQETGPYIGATWHHRFNQAGRLSITLAYAFLDGDNEVGAKPDDDEEDEEDNSFDNLSGQFDTDADGISASLNWTIPIGDQLSYITALKYQRYDQNFKPEGSKKIEIEEEYTELAIGLIYLF